MAPLAVSQGNGTRCVWHESIDSTNAEAHRLAACSDHGPVWICAREQLEGRGRHRDRHWSSPPGNLYATLLIELSAPAKTAGQLSFVASLAIYDALSKALGGTDLLDLKWPNDVLVDGRKVSGNLTEVIKTLDHSILIAIGCGINVTSSPSLTRYPAAHLGEFGSQPSLPDLFDGLRDAFQFWLERWSNGQSFDVIRENWMARTKSINRIVAVKTDCGTVAGVFERLGEDGSLEITLPDKSQRRFYAGDVSLVRE